ncbi:ATP-binding protein [Amycolatopsis sp. PS_44_ISF1]|uniref:ATP-binding protein n=1 Tax=Amycolatopsis sp. PS_44_ISF1 TaxID=2974917 RepID=UPI0028DE2D96|nr:ATP-binding protein [Amycolatopsis sp. PS_44_ISF1]MDT8914492.1 ATP-binding protein [Amycolatopsis sp. PS_44_ISF1]
MTSSNSTESAPSQPGVTARCSLSPAAGPDGPRQVRAWVRRTVSRLLPGVGASWVSDVVMVLDELVSNALRHGRGCRNVQVTLGEDHIVLQVTDASPAPARLVDTAVRRVSGLRLIEQACTRWGQGAARGGKTVWAELPRG